MVYEVHSISDLTDAIDKTVRYETTYQQLPVIRDLLQLFVVVVIA